MPEDTNTQQTPANQETPSPAQNGGQAGPPRKGEKPDPKWLNPRLTKAANAAVNQFLKDLGVKDAEELKQKIASAPTPEAQTQQKSEVEKLRTDLEAEKLRREQAELKQKVVAIEGTIKAAAKDAKHPEDVLEKFNLGANFADFWEGEAPNQKKIDARIAQIRKERPEWFKSTPGSPSNREGSNPKPDRDAKTKARDKLASQVRRSF